MAMLSAWCVVTDIDSISYPFINNMIRTQAAAAAHCLNVVKTTIVCKHFTQFFISLWVTTVEGKKIISMVYALCSLVLVNGIDSI